MNSPIRDLDRYWLPYLCLGILFLSTATVNAQTRTINASGNWSSTGIWLGGNRADNINENVQIVSSLGGSGVVTVNANYDVGYVNTGNNNDLLIDNNITLEIGDDDNADDLTIGNGSVVTVDAGGNLIIWGDLYIDEYDNAVLNITGTLTIHGNLILDDGANLTLNGPGTLTVEGHVVAEDDVTLDVNGRMVVEGDFYTEENLTLDIDGYLSVADDFEFNIEDDDDEDEGSDISISGTFLVGDDFDSDELDNLNFTVEDGGDITIGDDFIVDDDLDLVIHDGDMTIGNDFVGEDNTDIVVNDGGTLTIVDNIGTNGGSELDVNGSGTATAASCTGDSDVCDNLTVQLQVLYSRDNGDWDQGNTWSTTGFTGASCGCTPNDDRRVIIGNNRTVLLDNDGDVSGVEIQNTGRLRWDAGNVSLTMERGGDLDIHSGGVLTDDNETGATIRFGDDAYTSVIDGSLDMETLDFNDNAVFIVSGAGTVSAEVVRIDRGVRITNNITGASAGFTVSGDMIFESRDSDIINNGTMTLDDLTATGGNDNSFTNTGELEFSDIDLEDDDDNSYNVVINNSGTIDQTGNFNNVDAGSNFYNLSNGTWNFSGTGISGVRLHAASNSNTFNYNRNGNQDIITPVDAYSNLVLANGGRKDANNSFEVRRNWTRSGAATFDHGNNTVSFTGNLAQTISAVGGGETFYRLTIDNSSATSPQITSNNDVTVQSVLTMNDGNINMNGNILTLGTGTSAAGVGTLVHSAGWIYGGSFQRYIRSNGITIGDVEGFFPVGSQTDFRPFYIGKGGSGSGALTVSHTDPGGATDINFTDNTIPVSGGTVTIQRRHNSFWSVSKTGMTSGTFSIRAGGTGYTIDTRNDVRLTRENNATNIGTAAASSGSPTDVRANRTGLSSGQLVNNFYLASLDGSDSPLPVTLAYYRAEVRGDEVVSTWKTLQEKNNHFFTVEKTTDFENFYEVGVLDGEGDSMVENTYSFTDDTPFTGKSYYRLKQTDFDGKLSFSDPVMVEYDPLTPVLKAYPNPFNGQEITIEISGLTEVEMLPVQMFNGQGQMVMEIMVTEDRPGVLKKQVSFPVMLQPGFYILKAGKTLNLRRKILVR